MKKLIAISVVFALVAGVAFAVDLGGEVIATVEVIRADSNGSVDGTAYFKHVRVQGGGEVADGKFGGWLRIDPTQDGSFDLGTGAFAGYAWWKPIDQLKVSIGGNPDGIFAKEGNACWMFYQTASDTGVTDPGNAWYSTWTGGGFHMRKAFYGGFADPRLYITISPVDMVDINIAFPFQFGLHDYDAPTDAIGDIFKATAAQIDLKMSFGNIAFTYNGNSSIKESEVFGFFSLTAIDNLQLDFGLGANFQDTNPINLGIAVKYGADSWGIKFRSLFGIPIRSTQNFSMLFDVLPYFVINESFRVYISAGMDIGNIDALTVDSGWHVNPYIEIGEEWGPKFYAGLRIYATSFESPTVLFKLPIAIGVSF